MAEIFNYPPQEESKFNKFKGEGSTPTKWLVVLIIILLALFLFVRFFLLNLIGPGLEL